MADVDSDVSEFFKHRLSTWKNALARWHKKCGGKFEEEKQRKKRSYPVADRRVNLSNFKSKDATLSDATPYGYPSKTVDDQKKDDEVAKQAGKCRATIEYIQKMIEHLNNARTTGRFPSLRNYTIAVRKKPSFITRIDRDRMVDRGGVVEVVHRKGDWLQVKTGDTEGWVHKTELIPDLPIEYSSASGGAGLGGGDSSNRKEVLEGGRG